MWYLGVPHPPDPTLISSSPANSARRPSLPDTTAMAGVQGCGEGKIAGLYDLEHTLGKGHFAVVKLARHVFTGQRVAVKVIDKSKLAGEAAGQLLQEVRCMKLVQHPNVVRLYEVIDTHAKLYLILELGDGGDMFDHIMRHEGGLTEARAKHYFAQIVHAISYCHKLHVVHRDLKPENVVFFQEQEVVKLTDFGFSNRFQPGKMLTTSCGSLAYSAPEILLGDEYDAPAVDIWSLGVILYMLVCGHPPFQEANDSETLTMIMDCRYTVPPHVSAQCTDLISRMLQRDPKQRASLEQIEGHAWLQGVDPSPASRCLLPLTSHKRVSEEEHEIILQAMTCGNIADRDTIQDHVFPAGGEDAAGEAGEAGPPPQPRLQPGQGGAEQNQLIRHIWPRKQRWWPLALHGSIRWPHHESPAAPRSGPCWPANPWDPAEGPCR
nr:SNF-related serine/threonine-protein kinase-like isoform X2 [Columba livia]